MFNWLFSLLASIPRPEPLPKPHPDFPDPECKSCSVPLHQWNHGGVPEGIHCCKRCWAKVPVHERLKYQVMLEDRLPDGPISVLGKLVRGAVQRDDWSERGDER